MIATSTSTRWLALVLTLLACRAEAQERPAFAAPWSTEVERLDNGLTVILVPFATPGVAALFTGVRVGARDEIDAGRTGYAHLVEHMMFRGTELYPEARLKRQMQRLGADTSAYTWDDQTIYYTVGPTDGLSTAIAIEADRFRSLSFSQQDLRTEARAVLAEYKKSAADPWNRMLAALQATAFEHHPYGHTTMGHLADIERMADNHAYALAFRERHYTPARVVVAVVGDFDRERVLADVRAGYGGWAAPSAVGDPPPEPPQPGPRSRTVPWAAPTSPRVLIGWRVPGFSTADTTSAAVRVAAELAFGEVGGAYRRLVIDERALEDLDVWSWPHRDSFLLVVAARLREGTDPATIERALQDSASALAEGAATESAVTSARSHLLFEALLDLESPRDVANAIVFHATASGEPRAFERHLERLSAVTASDVQRVARTFFVPEQRTTIRLGRPSDKVGSADGDEDR